MATESVTYTFGKEYFQSPSAYNGFEVGPITVTVTPRKGESIADCLQRVHDEIESKVGGTAGLFMQKRNAFIERHKART